jgi:hypothetical protein
MSDANGVEWPPEDERSMMDMASNGQNSFINRLARAFLGQRGQIDGLRACVEDLTRQVVEAGLRDAAAGRIVDLGSFSGQQLLADLLAGKFPGQQAPSPPSLGGYHVQVDPTLSPNRIRLIGSDGTAMEFVRDDPSPP